MPECRDGEIGERTIRKVATCLLESGGAVIVPGATKISGRSQIGISAVGIHHVVTCVGIKGCPR